MEDKQQLRKHFLGLLQGQTSDSRLLKNTLIAQKLLGHKMYNQARTVLFYASLPYEVDTFAIMKVALNTGKRICLPVIDKDQKKIVSVVIDTVDTLQDSHFGIKEPVLTPQHTCQVNELDCVIVPGLAFDTQGNRLGRGAGYYDRFLSQLSPNTTTIGLAFDFQVIERLPLQGHDIALDAIIAN